MNNLRLAFKKAKKDKEHYDEVVEINKNPDYYLCEIQNMLINKTFTTSEYEVYEKNDKGKVREIYKLPFYPDRIVQWAIMLQIEDILVNHIPEYSHASIPGRGLHGASYQLRNYIEKSDYNWYLQIDIKKYFPSMMHNTVKEYYKGIFKDSDLLDLLFDIVDSIKGGQGNPIGNYTSQYNANINLVPVLNILKHDLKLKYIIVYMDDIIILGESKEYLQSVLEEIKILMWDILNLRIKDNYKVYNLSDKSGIDFVGYVHYKNYVLLRKSIKEDMIKVCNRINKKINSGVSINYTDYCSVNSYKGWLKHCDSRNLYLRYITPLKPHLDRYYREVIKSE